MARGRLVSGLALYGTYAKSARTVGSGDSAVTYTAVADSPNYEAGNTVKVEHVVSGADTPLSVSVAGSVITVNVETDGSSAAVSTASEVADAVNASTPASALVTAAAGGDGTGVVAAFAQAFLTGGTNRTLGRALR